MKHIYHYHAIWQAVCGGTAHTDGTAELNRPVDSREQYAALKKGIANECGITPEKLTICSLTPLSPQNADFQPTTPAPKSHEITNQHQTE